MLEFPELCFQAAASGQEGARSQHGPLVLESKPAQCRELHRGSAFFNSPLLIPGCVEPKSSSFNVSGSSFLGLQSQNCVFVIYY